GGVTIREISLYQGVKRQLMQDGRPATSDVPLVQGREALVRVFFDLDQKYNGNAVTALLEIEGQKPITVVQRLSGTSSDADLKSTINFNVPAEAVGPDTSYRVAMLQPKAQVRGDNLSARYPATGLERLEV